MNFLEENNTLLEKNLRFVKNEFEDEINSLMSPLVPSEHNPHFKTVYPTPGICIKFHLKSSNEKFFVNICQTDGIPQPEDITENQLLEMLREGRPGAFKVPMSISEPRQAQDKKGVASRVCDVAIHPSFLAKIQSGDLFCNFMITLVIEALDSKYNIKVKDDNFVVLKNRQCFDKLIPHRIQNRDVKAVQDSYKQKTGIKSEESVLELEAAGDGAPKKKLIEEIDSSEYKKVVDKKSIQSLAINKSDVYVPNPTKLAISQANTRKPEYKLFQEPAKGLPEKYIAEFLLPECISASEISVAVSTDRVLVEVRKRGYMMDAFVEHELKEDCANANFNIETKVLTLQLPVVA